MDKKETKNHPQSYDSLEQLIKDGRSLNQMQLEQELAWAEQEAKKNTQLPPGRFQDMLEELEKRGIVPRVMADFDKESQYVFKKGEFWEIREMLEDEAEGSCQEFESPQKYKRQKLKGIFGRKKRFLEHENYQKRKKFKKEIFSNSSKTAKIAAVYLGIAAAVFLLKPGLDVVGRRNYVYHSRIRNEKKGDIVWNNQENYSTDLSRLEEAYQEIKDKLGIAILKLNYIPEDIQLSKVSIEDRHARLEFTQQDNFLYVLEVTYPVDNSANRFSDCVEYKKIYNEWMDKWIYLQKNQLEDDLIEYDAYFEHENAYYYLQGIIEEEEFIQILKDMTLEIN